MQNESYFKLLTNGASPVYGVIVVNLAFKSFTLVQLWI